MVMFLGQARDVLPSITMPYGLDTDGQKQDSDFKTSQYITLRKDSTENHEGII